MIGFHLELLVHLVIAVQLIDIHSEFFVAQQFLALTGCRNTGPFCRRNIVFDRYRELTDEQKAFNRVLSAVRAIVERPFRVMGRQFGFVKVCYRGLKKNTGQIVTLFALANLWLASKHLLPLVGELRP